MSGTPGTGKTTLAKALAVELKASYTDVGRLVEVEGLYGAIDLKRSTKIVKLEALANRLNDIIKGAEGLVIVDGHIADIVTPDLVDLAIVLRTHPDELKRRLMEAGWPTRKVEENVASEILGDCLSRVVKAYGYSKVYEVDTTKLKPVEVLEIAKKIIKGLGEGFKPGLIDWLGLLYRGGKLKEYFP